MPAPRQRLDDLLGFAVMRNLFVLLMLLLSSVACSKPEPPTLTPERAEVVSGNQAGLVIRVQCKAHNPNSIPLPIRNVDGSITIGGSPLGGVSATSMNTLAANADTPVSFDLSVPWTNVAPALLTTVAVEEVPYVVQGTAQFEALGIKLSSPFTAQGKLRRAELVTAVARSAGMQRLPIPLPKFP
jgi:LEA14-like dessication related protein